MSAIITKCPICQLDTALGDPHFPFCSNRCRELDLGNWAMEKYVISTPIRPDLDLDADDDES